MALYSLFKITVLCALFQAAAAVRRQPPHTSRPSRFARVHLASIALPSPLSLRPIRSTRLVVPAPLRRLLRRPAPAPTAQGTPACSGTRTEANPSSSPDGVYSASGIKVGPGEVNHIDLTFPEQSFSGLQKYHQHLDGCMFTRTDLPKDTKCIPLPTPVDHDYTNGHYVDLGSNQGSMFIPAEKGNFINALLNIHWCPDQNYFLVKFLGKLLPTLEHHPTMFSPVKP